jgi:prepilin-type N-terminal cleavage/methylation domain-containing protein
MPMNARETPGTPPVADRSPRTYSSGFTIIEVLVVLAIAGLILLIVFEAIPALTRNSQNNQRRQDVSAILQGVSRYELNNSANFPLSVATALQYTQLTYYTAANVTLHGQTSPAQASVGPETSVDKVDVYNYEQCNASNPGVATTQGSDYSDIVALYAVEAGDGSAVGQCQQL